MKIAIPTADGRLCPHFGHCEAFALVDVDVESKTIEQTTMHQAPPHEPGVLPRWLHGLGANMVLAGGMGQRAQQLFVERGVDVIVGAPVDTPEQLVTAYLSGTLVPGANLCDH